MEEDNGHNSPSRLDRIENIVEVLVSRQGLIEEEFIKLLAAQTTASGQIAELAEAQKTTDEKLASFIGHTGQTLTVLMTTVDDIRGRK